MIRDWLMLMQFETEKGDKIVCTQTLSPLVIAEAWK